MAKASERKKLSTLLRELLGKRAPMDLLKEIDPDLVTQMEAGVPAPTLAELVAKKVVRLALDPQKQSQWAVELVFDRTEGKAVQGAAMKDDGRDTEKRLSDLTTEHLNSLAATYAKSAKPRRPEAEPQAEASGPASKLLDLRKDGPADSQEAGGQPPVASGVASEG